MYGSPEGVQAMVPAVGVLSQTSTPTEGQVTAWLSEATAVIDRTLSSAGWVVPVGQSAAVRPELTGLANLYAAARLVAARGLDAASGDSENRSSDWLERFDKQLADLAKANLTLVGVPLAASPTDPTPAYRRRLRTVQMKRIDGYSDDGRTD